MDILMNREQLSEYLGIGIRALDHIIQKMSVPHVRFGAKKYYRPASISRWLDKLEQESANVQ